MFFLGVPRRDRLLLESIFAEEVVLFRFPSVSSLLMTAMGGGCSSCSFDVTLARVVLRKISRCGIWFAGDLFFLGLGFLGFYPSSAFFPSQVYLEETECSRDLWKVCSTYGTAVDVFIPSKLSKAGKRFAFVRFIKVFNLDRLVENLCTLWIGSHHLFANHVRFDRPSKPKVQNIKFPPKNGTHQVLDDSCLVTKDLDNCVMGEVRQFSSINNLHVLLHNEGFPNVEIAYLGGLWVMIKLGSSTGKHNVMKHVGVASWFVRLCKAQSDFVANDRIVWIDIEGVPLHAWSQNTFQKIGSKWGEVMELEDDNVDLFACKRLCIKTNQADNILESFKIIVKGKVFRIRAKELFVWSPSFKKPPEVGHSTNDESVEEDIDNIVHDNNLNNLDEEMSSVIFVSVYLLACFFMLWTGRRGAASVINLDLWLGTNFPDPAVSSAHYSTGCRIKFNTMSNLRRSSWCLAWIAVIDLCEVYLPVPIYKYADIPFSLSSNLWKYPFQSSEPPSLFPDISLGAPD
ncbi:RNA-directed DNA polymerase, eukaryota, nucleotide-binding alpha-beta plait domain protein [Tanacetum coccineum]